MKRQHPYTPKCKCQRCQAVKKMVTHPIIKSILHKAVKRLVNCSPATRIRTGLPPAGISYEVFEDGEWIRRIKSERE